MERRDVVWGMLMGFFVVQGTLADTVALLRRRPSFFSLDKVREIAAVGWVADPGPARDALGFQPQIPISQGLAETAQAEGFTKREPATPA